MQRFLVALAAFVFVLPLTAHAVEYGGIGARPADAGVSEDRTGTWFVYTLAPGEGITDALVVTNGTAVKKTFDLYATDSVPATGDAFTLKQRTELMSCVGRWAQLAQDSVTLPPGADARVPFSVTIPAGTASGRYTGGIIVQERAAPSASGEIGFNIRLGVRMYLTVPTVITAVAPNISVTPRHQVSRAAPYVASAAAIGFAGVLLYVMESARIVRKPRKRVVRKRPTKRKTKR